MSQKIGNYTLGLEISGGGFGTCYEAWDDKNNSVCIKKIKINSDKDIKSIENEIEILKKMKSKHSVEFINGIKENNYYYIIMELCDGDLNKLLTMKKGNLDIITIIKIVIQINEAFKLMRNNKIEHRDLKPENILIKFKNEEKDFDIKLTDYGLAKYYENSNSKFSKQVGTPYYIAPEVYNNKGNSKSDLWSIGIILFYLYFNQLPFNDFDDYYNLNRQVNLKKTNNDLLDDLLSKLIVKAPEKRINWDYYFIHPFNTQQIIEIYVNIEIDNTKCKIIDNQYFKIEQLTNKTFYVDDFLC